VEQDEGLSEHEVLTRLPTGAWKVDPSSSQLNFRARTFLVLPVNGFFARFGGELTVDADGGVDGTLVVDTASVQTGIDRRDEQLRGTEFFATAQHPEMTFTVSSTGVGPVDVFEQARIEVTGSLRIGDRSLALGFPATVILHGDHLHVEAHVAIDLSAAGLGWTRPGIVGRSARADVALTLRPVASEASTRLAV
jgi:polyisoprenoid-binding protein YceI